MIYLYYGKSLRKSPHTLLTVKNKSNVLYTCLAINVITSMALKGARYRLEKRETVLSSTKGLSDRQGSLVDAISYRVLLLPKSRQI